VADGRTDPGPTSNRRPLTAVLAATFFVRFAFGITIAVFASYLSGTSNGIGSVDVGTVGLVSAMAPVGEFSTVLLSGAAADRYGRFPVLFAGIGLSAVLFAAIATTRSVVVLGGVNLLFGVASGAILAASLAVVADRSGEDERGYEMGRFDAMNLFGWVGGFAAGFAAVGAVPNARLGVVFLAGAAVLAAGLITAALLVRGAPRRATAPAFHLREVLRSAFRRSVLLVTLPWLVIYMLIGTALVFLAKAANGVGVSTAYLALVIGGGGALLVVTQPYFGRLADRFGRMRLMTVGATGFLLVMLFASLVVAWGAQVPLLAALGVSVLVALTYGPAALAALADLATGIGRATTMAIYSLTISLGMLGGLLASTSLFSRLGNLGLYLFFAGISAALVALTLARYREVRRLTTPAR
jgi:MFS family permease